MYSHDSKFIYPDSRPHEAKTSHSILETRRKDLSSRAGTSREGTSRGEIKTTPSRPHQSESKQLPQSIMRSPQKHYYKKSIEVSPQSVLTSKLDSTSFGMTPHEREMIKYKAQNDKVVGYYKKVLQDIRHTIKQERSQVQKYL
jgi:hypothetical protein